MAAAPGAGGACGWVGGTAPGGATGTGGLGGAGGTWAWAGCGGNRGADGAGTGGGPGFTCRVRGGGGRCCCCCPCRKEVIVKAIQHGVQICKVAPSHTPNKLFGSPL